jgi:hypothetical protein
VLWEYSLQRDETLAQAYYGHRRGGVHVTPEEVKAFSQHSQVKEDQVFFKFNMTTLARDAKADSVLTAELPALKSSYPVLVDTAKIRALCKSPNTVLTRNPQRLFIREIFQ